MFMTLNVHQKWMVSESEKEKNEKSTFVLILVSSKNTSYLLSCIGFVRSVLTEDKQIVRPQIPPSKGLVSSDRTIFSRESSEFLS